MQPNTQKDQVTLTHMSLRAAAKALGENVYGVQMLLAEGVLQRIKVVAATGQERMQVDARSVQAEVDRRASAKPVKRKKAVA